MARNAGIGSTLFGKSRLAILSLLLPDASNRFYLKQIVKLTRLGVGGTQRELAALAECGILTRTKEGRQVYFQANRQCPVYEELKSLVVKTGGVADVLRERLAPLRRTIRVAFIYGSFAEGKEDAQSDIDVMVVGSASFAKVSGALGDVQTALRREVNPTVYPEKEFSEKRRTPFLKSVLSKPRIFLCGDDRDLGRLAQ